MNSPAVAQLRPTARGRGEGSSTMSLSDDHFDQYTVKKEAANNKAMSPIPSSTFSPTASSIIHHDLGSSVELSAMDIDSVVDGDQPRLRRNRPSLIRQFEVNDTAVKQTTHHYINMPLITFLVAEFE